MKMLNKKEEILLNQYVQRIKSSRDIENWYAEFDDNDKASIISAVWGMARQAGIKKEDIMSAVKAAKLKETHTPVRMMNKQGAPFVNVGYNVAKLRGKEQGQAFMLILECFALAERRRKEICDANPKFCNHWWHQDLSDAKSWKLF